MKKIQYSIIKLTLQVFILVLVAGMINTLVELLVYQGYIYIAVYSLPIWFITFLAIIKDCVSPALSEEIMRHISCRKGKYTAFLYSVVLSFSEHFIIYSQEDNFSFSVRVIDHFLLTMIQYVGIGEKKPYLFMCMAISFHFLLNLNAMD